MSEQETTLRMKARTDVSEIRAYNAALKETNALMREARALSGGGGGAPSQAPANVLTGAPAPAPAQPLPPGSTGAPGPTGAPAAGGEAGPSALSDRDFDLAMQREARLQHQAQTSERRQTLRESQAGGGGGGGGGRGKPSMGQRAMGFAGNVASTGLGVALGGSLTGFLMSSAEHYMTVSIAVTKLGRSLREAGKDAVGFGGGLGYTMLQSAAMAEQLSAQTNEFDAGQAGNLAGFARTFGLDPGSMLKTGGMMSHLSGRGTTTDQLAQTIGAAVQQGMDKGRLGEFMETMARQAEQQFGATGSLSQNTLLDVMSMPQAIFGKDDPRSQGARGGQMLDKMHGMLRSKGPMEWFLMRAIGYGQKDSDMSYIDMRKRLAGGIHDPRNMAALFGSMGATGMNQTMMFRTLEQFGFEPHELDAMVKTYGNPEGVAELQRLGEGFDSKSQAGRRQAFLDMRKRAGLDMGEDLFSDNPDRPQLRNPQAFEEQGGQFISRGEVRQIALEAAQMPVGAVMSQVIVDLQKTLVDLATGFGALVDVDIGTLVTDMSGNLADIAANFNRLSHLPMFAGKLGPAEVAEQMFRKGTAFGAAFEAVEEVAPQIIKATPEFLAEVGEAAERADAQMGKHW